jgi:hypothetical protein
MEGKKLAIRLGPLQPIDFVVSKKRPKRRDFSPSLTGILYAALSVRQAVVYY